MMTSWDDHQEHNELNANGAPPKRRRISLRRPRTRAAAAAAAATHSTEKHQETQQLQPNASHTPDISATSVPTLAALIPHSEEANRTRPQRSLIARVTAAAFATSTAPKAGPVSSQSSTPSRSTRQQSNKRTPSSSPSSAAQSPFKQSNIKAAQGEPNAMVDARTDQLAPQKSYSTDTVSRGNYAATVSVMSNGATNSTSAATKPPDFKSTAITPTTSISSKRKFTSVLNTEEEEKRTTAAYQSSLTMDLDIPTPSSKVDDSETQPDPSGKKIAIDEIEDWDDEELNAFQGQEASPRSNTPENTCPICGINLLTLNDVTPEGHVNRCLDNPPIPDTPSSMSTDSSTTTSTTTLSSTVAAEPGTTTTSSSLVSSVTTLLGSVQQVVVNTASSSFSSITNTVMATTTVSGNASILPTGTGKASIKTSTRAPKPPKPCPFYKKMPDTTFTVDAFCYGCVPECTGYFLSHFHSDHYGGLTSTWKHGPIYCSSITANLVISRLNVNPQYVRRLPMYVPTVIDGVSVRLMDANHCPGSVLFVFDLPTNPPRRYLHTGDFRAHPSMITDPILRQPDNPPIDILYLDTTYINPKYTFPPQDAVIEATATMVAKELGVCTSVATTVSGASSLATATPNSAAPPKKKSASLMESWLKRMDGNSKKLKDMASKKTTSAPQTKSGNLSIWGTQRGSRGPTRYAGTWPDQVDGDKVLVCVGTYLIGKERVFMAIAKAIGSKVFIQPAKRRILECLEDQGLMDMLTDDPREAQVHLVHMGSDLSPASLQTYLDSLQPRFERIIAIRPTGWTFSPSKKAGPESAVRPSPVNSNDNARGSSSGNPTVTTTLATPTSSSGTGGAEGDGSGPLDHPPIVFKPSFASDKIKIYGVPYSEHSSFSELAGFVRSLQIVKVIPTVGVGTEKGRLTMRAWFDRWAKERDRGIRWRAVEPGDHITVAKENVEDAITTTTDETIATKTEGALSSSSSSTLACTPRPIDDTPLEEMQDIPLLSEEFDR